MLEVIKRAFRDSVRLLVSSWRNIIRSIVLWAGSFVLLFFFGDEENIAQEVSRIFLYVVAGALFVVIPTFLWNLWLAPYRIMQECLDDAIKNNQLSNTEIPRGVDLADYSHHKNVLLYEAACLWVEVEPHHPVRHPRAKAKLSLLKSAIRGGELVCYWENDFVRVMNAISGGKPRSPDNRQQVTLVALRRYADRIGELPEFLREVQLPPELPALDETE